MSLPETIYQILANTAVVFALTYAILAWLGQKGADRKIRDLTNIVVFSGLMALAVVQSIALADGVNIDAHGGILAASIVFLGAKRSIVPALSGIVASYALSDPDLIGGSAGILLSFFAATAAVWLVKQTGAKRSVSWLTFLIPASVAGIADNLPLLFTIPHPNLSLLIEAAAFEVLAAGVFSSLVWIGESRHEAIQANLALTHRLRSAIQETADALGYAMEHRDVVTGDHQNRSAQLVKVVGEALGLDEIRIEGLTLAALLHDIGQIEVPSEILSRPGPLTSAERSLVKLHPEVGHDILKGIEFEQPVAEIVYQHQERFDGSGYPRGLKGEKIMLEARILRLCDTVIALSSPRPYRPPYDREYILKAVREGAGREFDPEVASAFLAAHTSDDPRLEIIRPDKLGRGRKKQAA